MDPKITDTTKRTYAAMVMAMDKNVAAILGELDRLGLRENTIVVFTSDNGATKDGSNLPFRGGEHSVFEGGTRLPTVIHWPKGAIVDRILITPNSAYEPEPDQRAADKSLIGKGPAESPARPWQGKRQTGNE